VPIDIFRGFEIDPVVRSTNLELYLKEGLIDQQTFNQLTKETTEL